LVGHRIFLIVDRPDHLSEVFDVYPSSTRGSVETGYDEAPPPEP
jgi:hypothetical protein